jgi:chemotaxis protein MotA
VDLGGIIGIIIGFAGILTGYILEEGVLGALIQKAAIFIVFGGTIGATVLSFPIEDLKKIPDAFKMVFTTKKFDEVGIINELSSLSEKARKDGLLALEQDAQQHSNEFIRKGLSLVVDGIEAETIKDILVREIDLRESLHEQAAKIFEAAGGFAPTMGVTGTVMGMVSILGSMDEDPDGLGGKIASAFIATFYGIATANLLWLPMAGRIKAKASKEKLVNDLIVEGLLSIQAGENPRIIKEKLNLSLMEKLSGKKGTSSQETGSTAEG